MGRFSPVAGRSGRWGIILFTCVCVERAAAAPPARAATADAELPAGASSREDGGTGALGLRGFHRLVLPQAMRPGEVVLAMGAAYFATHDFLLTGDHHARQTQRLTAAWSPGGGFDVALGYALSSNTNDAFPSEVIQASGDPTVAAKYSHTLFSGFPWFAGAAFPGVATAIGATFLVPSAATGHGLQFNATTVEVYLALSSQFLPWLEVGVNAGVRLDRTNAIFVTRVDRAQRFAAGVSEASALTAAVGLGARYEIRNLVTLQPFFEVVGAGGIGVAMADSPLLASAGLRLRPYGQRSVEVVGGGDVRLLGAPRPDGRLAGLPPWEIFARLIIHVGDAFDQEAQASVVTRDEMPGHCQDDAACAGGLVCLDGVCGRRLEVVKIKEVQRDAPRFFVVGKVVDDQDKPVPNAKIYVSGFAETILAASGEGAFRSWGLPAGEGLVQLKVVAAGFRSAEETFPRGAEGEVKELVVTLTSDAQALLGELRGSLKDARDGTSIAEGKIFIPGLRKGVTTDGEGAFRVDLQAGEYQVLISAEGYITQQKKIYIRAGEAVILNVDLRPKRRKFR